MLFVCLQIYPYVDNIVFFCQKKTLETFSSTRPSLPPALLVLLAPLLPSNYLTGMAYAPPHGNANCSLLFQKCCSVSYLGISALPILQQGLGARTGMLSLQCLNGKRSYTLTEKRFCGGGKFSKKERFSIPRSTTSSNSNDSADDRSDQTKKASFGNSRKDVILIGVGVTLLGIGLKSGLEYAGVDPLQAGNVVQLVLVLGLTLGWISTYIFRVSNKEMTYAQQLRDYESKVMEKRLESLTEAELEALLQEVEEEKSR